MIRSAKKVFEVGNRVNLEDYEFRYLKPFDIIFINDFRSLVMSDSRETDLLEVLVRDNNILRVSMLENPSLGASALRVVAVEEDEKQQAYYERIMMEANY